MTNSLQKAGKRSLKNNRLRVLPAERCAKLNAATLWTMLMVRQGVVPLKDSQKLKMRPHVGLRLVGALATSSLWLRTPLRVSPVRPGIVTSLGVFLAVGTIREVCHRRGISSHISSGADSPQYFLVPSCGRLSLPRRGSLILRFFLH